MNLLGIIVRIVYLNYLEGRYIIRTRKRLGVLK